MSIVRSGMGSSEAVDANAWAGLKPAPRARRYEHESSSIGMRIDVTNVGEALDLLDER